MEDIFFVGTATSFIAFVYIMLALAPVACVLLSKLFSHEVSYIKLSSMLFVLEIVGVIIPFMIFLHVEYNSQAAFGIENLTIGAVTIWLMFAYLVAFSLVSAAAVFFISYRRVAQAKLWHFLLIIPLIKFTIPLLVYYIVFLVT